MDSYLIIRNNIEDYIHFNIGYSIISNPELLDVINSPDIFKAIRTKAIQITRNRFEENIPNNQVGITYVDFYNSSGEFYELFDETDNTSTYLIIVKEQIVMFFEIKK